MAWNPNEGQTFEQYVDENQENWSSVLGPIDIIKDKIYTMSNKRVSNKGGK